MVFKAGNPRTGQGRHAGDERDQVDAPIPHLWGIERPRRVGAEEAHVGRQTSGGKARIALRESRGAKA